MMNCVLLSNHIPSYVSFALGLYIKLQNCLTVVRKRLYFKIVNAIGSFLYSYEMNSKFLRYIYIMHTFVYFNVTFQLSFY